MKVLNPKMKDFPGQNINVVINGPKLDFSKAKDFARLKAKEKCADPMLLSWYQGDTGKYYPDFDCGGSDKPPWLVYAESRGGDLTININEGQYVFIYLSLD